MSPITQKIRKLFALLLALCLSLSLVACGKDEKEADDSTEQLGDTVYVPEFLDLSAAGEIESLQSACAIGNSIFLLATVTGEEASDSVTGDATSTALFRVDTDGTVERLTNYEPLPVPEGMDGYSDPANIAAGPGDTLWVTEYMTYYKLDLPEDFDPVYGNKSNYMTGYTERKMLRQLDTTGSEITRLDTTYLSRKLAPAGTGFSYGDSTSEYLIDGEGNLWTAAITGLWAVDSELNPLFSLSLDGDPPVVLGDGTIGTRTGYLDTLTGTFGFQLQVADMESQSWETAYLLPNEAFDLYPGGGDYLFYYISGDTLYGCRADTAVPTEDGQLRAVGEELLSWMDVNISPSSIVSFTFLSNGQVAVFFREQEDWAYHETRYTYELALLTPAERSSVPEKTILTYGAMTYILPEEWDRIVEFNRNSDEYHIEAIKYTKFNTADDPLGNYTRLGAEIMSGTIPDILSTCAMPLEQMGARGLLEDLWTYIDSDTELGGREALMTRVLEAASDREGHLYQVFSSFNIETVMGAPSVVGDRMRWTVADLEDALAGMPEGCTIFSDRDTARSVLRNILSRNLNSFVNWETGECSFDSGEFRSLLQFCAGFPYVISNTSSGNEGDNEVTRIYEGRQMLMKTTIQRFYDLQENKADFGGSVSYVGYPMEDGSCGSSFYPGNELGLAISSTCAHKEGAWSFVRQLLLPNVSKRYADLDADELARGCLNHYGFFTNKADFDFMAKGAMTPVYQRDAHGNVVLDNHGQPIEKSFMLYSFGNGQQVNLMSTTQEEYDQLMALYNEIDRLDVYDQRIYDIIDDAAGGYFAGDFSLDTVIANIQSRVELYVNEQR